MPKKGRSLSFSCVHSNETRRQTLLHSSDSYTKAARRTQQAVNNNNNNNAVTKQNNQPLFSITLAHWNSTTPPHRAFATYHTLKTLNTPSWHQQFQLLCVALQLNCSTHTTPTAVDTPAYTPAIPPLLGPLRFVPLSNVPLSYTYIARTFSAIFSVKIVNKSVSAASRIVTLSRWWATLG